MAAGKGVRSGTSHDLHLASSSLCIQEAETSVVAMDVSRQAAVLALAVFMKDDWSLFARTFHGDEDIFRMACLITRSPLFFNRLLPDSSIIGGGCNALVHWQALQSLIRINNCYAVHRMKH